MPIYEYECSACGHRTEVLQGLGDAPLSVCPECGKSAMHKLISPAGFRLGGKGWYETDFKSGRGRNLAEKDSGGSSEGSKSTTSSTPAATD